MRRMPLSSATTAVPKSEAAARAHRHNRPDRYLGLVSEEVDRNEVHVGEGRD